MQYLVITTLFYKVYPFNLPRCYFRRTKGLNRTAIEIEGIRYFFQLKFVTKLVFRFKISIIHFYCFEINLKLKLKKNVINVAH